MSLASDDEAARARLIAAAPDLLRAAKIAVDDVNDDYVRKILLAAIAKAEGAPDLLNAAKTFLDEMTDENHQRLADAIAKMMGAK